MIGAGVTKIIDDVELQNAPNYGYGVSSTECNRGEYIYSFYNPMYDWNTDSKFASLISNANVLMLSEKITQQLEGVHPEGKRIVVPTETIRQVLATKFKTFQSFDIIKINDEAVSFIVGYIRSEFRAIKTNQSYSIWNTVLGDDNELGLMPLPPIKTKLKQKNKIMMWNY